MGPTKQVSNHQPADDNKIMFERFSDRDSPPEKRRKIEIKLPDEDDEFFNLINLYKKA
jgi:hypothetical protein